MVYPNDPMNARKNSIQPEQAKQELIESLQTVRSQIINAARCLPPSAKDQVFLGVWDVRDLLAHLIGWDRANRQAVGEVLESRLPSFYQYADRDWRSYNSRLVEQFRQVNLGDLLDEVQSSHRELLDVLRNVPAEDLNRDLGVRYKGWKVTIARLLAAELSDEKEHLAQLDEFARRF